MRSSSLIVLVETLRGCDFWLFFVDGGKDLGRNVPRAAGKESQFVQYSV